MMTLHLISSGGVIEGTLEFKIKPNVCFFNITAHRQLSDRIIPEACLSCFLISQDPAYLHIPWDVLLSPWMGGVFSVKLKCTETDKQSCLAFMVVNAFNCFCPI